MTYNDITHVKSSLYHPSTNGLAEQAFQTFKLKAGIKKQSKGTLESKLSYFLFHYHLTPQITTGQSPSELLLGRHIKSCLDLLHPNVKTKAKPTMIKAEL